MHIAARTGTLTAMAVDPSIAIYQILDALNRHRIRATYGAVAELIGGLPLGVSQRLGERRRYASWVVAKRTGKPSGYRLDQIHPDIEATRRIITTGDELRRLVQQR